MKKGTGGRGGAQRVRLIFRRVANKWRVVPIARRTFGRYYGL